MPSAAAALAAAAASKVSTGRWLGGGPAGEPAASIHSGTVRPAVRPLLTGI